VEAKQLNIATFLVGPGSGLVWVCLWLAFTFKSFTIQWRQIKHNPSPSEPLRPYLFCWQGIYDPFVPVAKRMLGLPGK